MRMQAFQSLIKSYLFISFFFFLFIENLCSQNHWETAIFASDDWKYIIPNSELPANWKSLTYNDNIWNEGPGGFGYSDNDDGTIIETTMSVYLRKNFYVSDLSKLSRAVLSADYDDGFIAYINGHEIGRSYNLPDPGTFVEFDEGTSYDHEASLYNGGQPESFIIDSLEIQSYLDNGENILAIQVHNIDLNSSDMSSNFYLTFEITDNSEFYSNPPPWFQEPIAFGESNLPIILINTFGQQIIDDPRIPAYMGIIDNSSGINQIDDPYNNYDGHITIEKRGNSSQWQEKAPYRFETVDNDGENNNVELLGMPTENDWVLYAPWQDKTMIRNALTYNLSNQIGRYASRTRHIELYINEEYRGVYVLMEKIKRDNDRIDISKLEPNEITGDELTGGYILKFDWYYTGDNIGGFESANDGMLYNYHYPKASDIVPEQENYIQTYINNFESIMLNDDYTNELTGYPSIMNVESFIDFILLQELSKNVDAYRLSTYICKDKNSVDERLTAGPVWDFNHGYGNCDYGQTWETENWLLEYNPEGGDQMAFWWELLWEDENFKLKTAERYSALRSTIFSTNNINSIIDSIVNHIGPAVDRNFNRWALLGNYVWPNYYVFDTYEEEINYLKSWTAERLEWMDSEILLLDIKKDILPLESSLKNPYPNPFNPKTTFTIEHNTQSSIMLDIYNILGKKIWSFNNQILPKGEHKIIWNSVDDEGNSIESGVYLYKYYINNNSKTGKLFYIK